MTPEKFFRAIIRCSKKMIRAGRGKTIEAVREVLDPPDVDMRALLHMRARANRGEEDIRRVERLLSVVNLETTGWRRLVKVAERGVFHFLPTSSCEFATFIRCVTFHTWVVGVLNPDDPQNRELQHVDLRRSTTFSDSGSQAARMIPITGQSTWYFRCMTSYGD